MLLGKAIVVPFYRPGWLSVERQILKIPARIGTSSGTH